MRNIFFCIFLIIYGTCSYGLSVDLLDCSKSIRCSYDSQTLKTNATTISGPWKVFNQKLLTPVEFSVHTEKADERDIAPFFVNLYGSSKGFASYQKEFVLDKAMTLGIFLSATSSSRKVWLNNELILDQGKVSSTSVDDLEGRSQLVFGSAVEGINTITIQISNYKHYFGGHTRNVIIGSPMVMNKLTNTYAVRDMINIGAILIMSFYQFYLWAIRPREKGPLFFAIFCLCIGMRSSFSGSSQILFKLIPSASYNFGVHLEYLGLSLSVPSIFWFMHSQFYKEFTKKITTTMSVPGIIWGLLVLSTSALTFPSLLKIGQVYLVIAGIIMISLLILAIVRKRSGALLSLSGFGVFFATVIYDILLARKVLEGHELSHLGLFAFLFFQSINLAFRFTQSFIKLDHAEKKIRLLNQDLERKVEERTKQISIILNNAQSGFLLIDSEGTIQGAFTSYTRELLGDIKAGDNLINYFKVSNSEREQFLAAITQCFFVGLPESVRIAQIPSKLHSLENKIIAASYSIVKNDSEVVAILVTLDDASELEAAEKQMRHDQLLINILINRRSFNNFVDNSRVHCHQAINRINNQDEVRSIIHTLKGNCSVFGFDELVQTIHNIEDRVKIEISDIKIILEEFNAKLEVFSDFIDIGDQYLSLAKSDFQLLQKHIEQLQNPDEKLMLKKTVLNSTLPRAHDILGPIEKMVNQQAKKSGKKVKFTFTGGSSHIENRFTPIVENISHLLRNSLDHGIEYPSERGEKTPEASIKLDIANTKQGCTIIRVIDDGKGINIGSIIDKANRLGIDISQYKTPKDIVNLIFNPDFSTNEEVTDTSGRGFGLAAISAAVESVGGSIEIENKPGKGCEFIITLESSTDVKQAI